MDRRRERAGRRGEGRGGFWVLGVFPKVEEGLFERFFAERLFKRCDT